MSPIFGAKARSTAEYRGRSSRFDYMVRHLPVISAPGTFSLWCLACNCEPLDFSCRRVELCAIRIEELCIRNGAGFTGNDFIYVIGKPRDNNPSINFHLDLCPVEIVFVDDYELRFLACHQGIQSNSLRGWPCTHGG